ncbi:Sarcosine oxidase, gamma subunit family [Roseovarius gaetbuli]|uniref:Sarcosine oxidase, gamma subunit family n=1 Tax=Roseovarius gaetbuli TaxID=1356575 RepID=A0A1X6ZAG3_9RHOB|nr:sarcosine oxidase subunit gamma family protein [Roseovarius gaetbuli]SLN45944.1 Sarcosine oxidase, gamma subunit family [Roseovarius gaetbuli]
MSNAVSALAGTSYDGFARIEDQGLRGMITLRGDLASKEVKAVVKATTGLAVPGQRQALSGKDTAALWMSPDELLLMCPYGDVASVIEKIETALKGQHFLAVNVSDARTFLRISGAGAREVLAKVCPVDLSPEAFTPGMFRRTRMAQVPAAFWLDEAGAFHLVCFRSIADYAFNLLKTSAKPGGEVGYFA